MALLHGVLVAAAGILTLGSLIYLVMAHLATMRHYAGATAPPLSDEVPPVSLCKAIEGAEERTYSALESFLDVRYPGRVEFLIGTIQVDNPIVEVVERLQAAHPDRDIRLVFGEVFGTNRKTCIMHELLQQATTDILIFSDGDTRATPDYLEHVVPPLLDPEVGCITCLPRGIGTANLASRIIALHYVHVYVPNWMAAVQTTGVHWAFGNTMGARREVIEAYGGFQGFPDHLADDYEFGARADALGKRVVVPPYLIDTYMPQESVRSTLVRLLRWMRTIRVCRPKAFAGLAFTYPLPWSLVLALLTGGAGWAVFAAVLALRMALAWRLDRQALHLPEWHQLWYLLPLVDLIELGTFVAAYAGNTVVWAGRRFRLHPDGRLERLDEPTA